MRQVDLELLGHAMTSDGLGKIRKGGGSQTQLARLGHWQGQISCIFHDIHDDICYVYYEIISDIHQISLISRYDYLIPRYDYMTS
jgi:hypothetical protein